MLMDGGDDMKNYKKLVIKVDETIASELIANDSDDFDGQDLNEDDQTYYLKDPIEKDDYMIHEGRIILHEDTDVLLSDYALLKVNEEQYRRLDTQYLLCSRKESYGCSCLTNQKQFYLENYPEIAVEKGSIDNVVTMMIRGEKL